MGQNKTLLGIVVGAALVGATALAAPGAAADQVESLTLRELLHKPHHKFGKQVVVRGWLARCLSYECRLYYSEREAKLDSPWYVSLGRNDDLERQFRQKGPGRVTLRGTLADRCINAPPAFAICDGRPETFIPSEVVGWRPK